MSEYLVKRLLSTPSIEPEGMGVGVGEGCVVGVTARDGVATGVFTALVAVGNGFTNAVVAVR